ERRPLDRDDLVDRLPAAEETALRLRAENGHVARLLDVALVDEAPGVHRQRADAGEARADAVDARLGGLVEVAQTGAPDDDLGAEVPDLRLAAQRGQVLVPELDRLAGAGDARGDARAAAPVDHQVAPERLHILPRSLREPADEADQEDDGGDPPR